MSDISSNDNPVAGMRLVNGYELLEEIGSGGMSRVYRARRQATGERFAVKVIRIEDVEEDFERRLRREPEIQQGLGHENIVQLFDWFRVNDEFFLVMELVEGLSLSQLIHGEAGPMPFDRARGYLRQMLRAVNHLHSLGIIHRDIKPGNILIGRDDVAKLADFGIAKFTWQQGQTRTQKGLGTPEYMSPEQARGERIDGRTDIYSLGITLFEMLTARKPFTRREETPMAYVEVIQSIISTPLPDPREFYPGIPSGVVRFLQRATAKNPDDRFHSAAEMLGALEIIEDGDASPATVVGGMPMNAPRPSNPQPTASASGRSTEREAEFRRTPPAEVQEERSNGVLWVIGLLLLLSVGGYFGYDYYQRQQIPMTGLTDSTAMVISQKLVSDYIQFARTHNPSGLASLYAENGVEYLTMKRASRKDILTDSEKYYKHLTRTDQFEVQVKKARALNDSTVDSEWIITYQREKDDGTLLRGATSNLMRFVRIDGDWYISRQRENWIKRDNVAPVIDTPTVVDIQADSAIANVETQTRQNVASDFIRMIDAGKAESAWDTYAASKIRSGSDRDNFMLKFSGQHLELLKIAREGDQVVATIGQVAGDGFAGVYRMVFSFVDENGPRISSIEVKQLSSKQ